MKILNWIACGFWFITGIMMCFGYKPLLGFLIASCFTSGMFFLEHATRRY